MVHPKRKTSKKTVESESNVTTRAAETFHDLWVENGLLQMMITQVQEYAIIVLNKTGNIVFWNKGAEILSGYQANEMADQNFRILYDKDLRELNAPQQLLEEAEAKGRTNAEGWYVKRDGSRFWGNLSVSIHYDKNNEAVGFFVVIHDFTERKRYEDNYSNYVEELKLENTELKNSEERYHKMVTEVQDYAIILLDRNGIILDWNKGAEKVKGYKPAEIIGKSFRLFYSREDKESNLPEKLLNEAVTHGRVQHEGWRIKKGGTRFWGSVAITALHDDNDNVIGFTKVTRDLTDRKKNEDRLSNYAEELNQKVEALRKSEERYHKMISEIQDYSVILLNENGDIENWNIGAERIKGYSAREVVGRNFRIFYTKEDLEKNLPEKLLSDAITNGKAIHEGWRVRKDGTKFWGSIVITALHDNDGKVMGFSKITRDLSERKKAEDMLQANAAQLDLKNNKLERLNAELSSFTYIASHDLKEPLRKIQAFSSMMENLKPLPENALHYLDKIKNSASRMQNLIEDLLSYSLISNDSSKVELVDLNDILAAVKNDLEITISEKQAVINAVTLPKIEGISFQFHQMFLNILSNALKFSKPDVAPVINIAYSIIEGPDISGEAIMRNNRYHHIAISDNGIGFEPQYASKIFGAFQRLHAKNVFSGTGIGLAIVKKVIENLNGIIVADGKPDIGATFHLYLPL